MRVLSLWQPWASLTVTVDPERNDFAKRFETRHWIPRGKDFRSLRRADGSWELAPSIDVAIHATQKDVTQRVTSASLLHVIARCGLLHERPRGSVIGIATLQNVYRSDAISEEPYERIVGDWSEGRYVWLLENVQPLDEPVPITGRQEPLWILPADIEAQVREQVAA